MLLLLGAFIAGILTVLAPCVLPLLPIIIGGSVSGDEADKKRPLYITASLALSLLVFTLLLKATTVLIGVPPEWFAYISGIIIVALGIFTLFPSLYATFLAKVGIESKALSFLSKGQKQSNPMFGAILTGAALGPVFSSCSPVYGYILATVLPVNFSLAMLYMSAYILGLSFVLLLIGYFGQRFIKKISWMSNPKGAFQRLIAVLFIIVGLMVFTGLDKDFQAFISRNTPFNIDALSAKLIPASQREYKDGELLNVDPYPAPEFAGLEDWINSEPLTLESLRGQVVLVDFWTYSCINCVRNNPYIEGWYQQYKDDGFTVIGAHAPEFAFERNVENVQKAVRDQNISYPVALDNDFSTWGAFENQFWPTYYLIDAQGNVRRIHSGEGEYRESEQAIRQLLTENGAFLSDDEITTEGDAVDYITKQQTPETYLGLKRASNFASKEPLGSGGPFTSPAKLASNQWSLSGKWDVGNETITSSEDSAKLAFNIRAKAVYVVASSESGNQIKVLVNGQPANGSNAGSDVKNGAVTVQEARLYRLVEFDQFQESINLELTVPKGVSLNVFTFGS